MQIDEAASILGGADFFNICSLEQRRMLAFSTETRTLKEGEILFERGQVIDGAYVLVEGVLGSTEREGGDEVRIEDPGATLGELALLVAQPRRASVRAVTDCELIFVPRASFLKLIEQFPDLARATQRRIAENLTQFVSPLTENLRKIR